jgi:hypothetical protein
MPGPKSRIHYKVQQLPEEIVSEVNALIVAGHTYAEIAAHLRTMGHAVSKSSVARYGAQYLEKYRRLKESAEIAKTIVEGNGNTDLEEAATKLALDLVLQRLLGTPELGGELDICRALDSLTRAQSSGVQREKWKTELRARVEKAAQACEKTAKQGGLSDQAAATIRSKILGIAA